MGGARKNCQYRKVLVSDDLFVKLNVSFDNIKYISQSQVSAFQMQH